MVPRVRARLPLGPWGPWVPRVGSFGRVAGRVMVVSGSERAQSGELELGPAGKTRVSFRGAPVDCKPTNLRTEQVADALGVVLRPGRGDARHHLVANELASSPSWRPRRRPCRCSRRRWRSRKKTPNARGFREVGPLSAGCKLCSRIRLGGRALGVLSESVGEKRSEKGVNRLGHS